MENLDSKDLSIVSLSLLYLSNNKFTIIVYSLSVPIEKLVNNSLATGNIDILGNYKITAIELSKTVAITSLTTLYENIVKIVKNNLDINNKRVFNISISVKIWL